LFRSYAANADFETLLEGRREGHVPRPDLMALRGARLVTAIEVGEGQRLNESLIKSLTGKDTISARGLHENRMTEFAPTFKLWLAANHKPAIRGTDPAIWRRIHLVPFAVEIPERKRDPGLADKLLAELPGILNWAIEGCRLWSDGSLEPPSAVRDATAAYRSQMDILGAFIADCCEVDAGFDVGATPLYNRYREWCRNTGETEISQRKFGEKLSARGFGTARDGGSRATLRTKLRLRASAEPSNGSGTEPSAKAFNNCLTIPTATGYGTVPEPSDPLLQEVERARVLVGKSSAAGSERSEGSGADDDYERVERLAIAEESSPL
jgi:putative DNA primase/helicase